MADYRRAYTRLTTTTKRKQIKILKSMGSDRSDYKIIKDPNGYYEIWLKAGRR